MTTCLGQSCSFDQLCVSFVGVGQILCVSFFPNGLEGGVRAVIV